MKLSRADVRGKATLGMELRFETQGLTSYSGLILFQHFFSLIGIKERLWRPVSCRKSSLESPFSPTYMRFSGPCGM